MYWGTKSKRLKTKSTNTKRVHRHTYTRTRKKNISRKPAFNLIKQWIHVVSSYWQCISTNCTHYFNFPVGCIDFTSLSQSFICSYIPSPPSSNHLPTNDKYVHRTFIIASDGNFHFSATNKHANMQSDAPAHRLILIMFCTCIANVAVLQIHLKLN